MTDVKNLKVESA